MDVSNACPVLTDTAMTAMRTGRLPCAKFQRKNLDDVRSNGWVDAMLASSPPRRKLSKDRDCDCELLADGSHADWMIKCPSALKSLERIAKVSRKKKIAVFLDYDGTLSPIVDDPDQAIISEEMRSAVRGISKRFPTAIISGRNRDKVFDLVKVPGLHYAGSHGMDIVLPQWGRSKSRLFQPAREFIQMIEEVFEALVCKTSWIKGAKVENHKFCASVHYRNVEEREWPAIAQIVHDILKEYPRLRLTHGRKVLEVRPAIDWNKGKAVEFILKSLEIDAEDVFPIYIGDDRTDEDAFMVLKKTNRGCGILVASAPKETSASYSLKDPKEVLLFLNALTKLSMV